MYDEKEFIEAFSQKISEMKFRLNHLVKDTSKDSKETFRVKLEETITIADDINTFLFQTVEKLKNSSIN